MSEYQVEHDMEAYGMAVGMRPMVHCTRRPSCGRSVTQPGGRRLAMKPPTRLSQSAAKMATNEMP